MLKDYTTEYEFDTPFERELKQEVFKIVPRGKEFGTPGYFARAIFYVALYFGLQVCPIVCMTCDMFFALN